MKQSLLFLFFFAIGSTCFSSDVLKLYQKTLEFDKEYLVNKNSVIDCESGKSNSPTNVGCVSSYKFLKNICLLRQEYKYEKRNPHIRAKYYSESCDLVDRVDRVFVKFIDQDAKACRDGFETLQKRLQFVSENKDVLVDGVAFRYEMGSCKQIKTYVNLCAYIDGDLKDSMPRTNEFLPDLQTNNSKLLSCNGQETSLSAIVNFNKEIESFEGDLQKPIYHQIITDRRKRTPAGNKHAECEQVRSVFLNLRCDKYDLVSDEDPIYLSEEEMQKRRIEKQNRISEINSGGNKKNNEGGASN